MYCLHVVILHLDSLHEIFTQSQTNKTVSFLRHQYSSSCRAETLHPDSSAHNNRPQTFTQNGVQCTQVTWFVKSKFGLYSFSNFTIDLLLFSNATSKAHLPSYTHTHTHTFTYGHTVPTAQQHTHFSLNVHICAAIQQHTYTLHGISSNTNSQSGRSRLSNNNKMCTCHTSRTTCVCVCVCK